MRKRLQEVGATLVQPERLMRRVNLDYPDRRLNEVNGWVRVRDEGDKITLAYKQLDNRGLDGTKEVQVTVSDFKDTVAFLQAIGLRQENYQESKRESWELDGVEIELDEWPWVKPFLEMEGRDEAQLRGIAGKLGLDWAQTVHGSVEIAYLAEYDVTEQEVDDWEDYNLWAGTGLAGGEAQGMNILYIGDVMGEMGLQAVEKVLPRLRTGAGYHRRHGDCAG